MPPLPVISGVKRVAFEWSGPNGLSAVNVMHFFAGAQTSAGLWALLETHVQQNMWQVSTLSSVIKTVDILPLDGASGTASFVPPATVKWAGSSTGDPIPQAAVIAKFGTGLRGRHRRGRVFIPFPTEALVTAGDITPANVALMQSAWNAFLTGMDGAGTPLVVASYSRLDFAEVTSVTVEPVIATQRRRQGRLRRARGL